MPPPVARRAADVLLTRRHRLPPALDRGLDRLKWLRVPWAADPRGNPGLRTQDGEGARVLIAPANFAGQGAAWARALRAEGVPAVAWQLSANTTFAYPADHRAPIAVNRASTVWQRGVWDRVVDAVDAVVIEAGRPVFGRLHGFDPVREARALAQARVRVALLWHGTDIRVPSEHARTHPRSPFVDPTDPRIRALEAVARRNRARLATFDGPVLVSTPDLLDVPGSRWCPVVVDVESWTGGPPVLEREVPVVVHVPSNPVLKGSELIEPVLRRMHEQGRVEYRTATGLTADGVRELYRDADIVLDQFRLGIYGVAACEAMAAGRLVVSDVDPRVRERVRAAAGTDLPVLQAEPGSLEQVLSEVLADRPRARAAAAAGPDLVRALHDGRRSAEVLRTELLPDVP